MGPKLTIEEITEIEYLAEKYHYHNYSETFNKHRPSLTRIKALYDIAISQNPPIETEIKKKKKKMTDREIKELINQQNRNAVDLLKKL